jgi:hypothetical protein
MSGATGGGLESTRNVEGAYTVRAGHKKAHIKFKTMGTYILDTGGEKAAKIKFVGALLLAVRFWSL